jgi:hypothetical protein
MENRAACRPPRARRNRMTATLPDTKYKRMLKTPVIARVGVFWWWEGQLLEDSVSLPDGDPSDDVINGRNDHVKVWPHFQKTYPSLSEKDYIAVPRGRVLYRCHERKFIVYLDRKIATPQVNPCAKS